MINYLNFKRFKDKYLITNDFGRYRFLDVRDFVSLIADKIDFGSTLYKQLSDNYFIFNDCPQSFADNVAYDMLRSKSYLLQATALHIFVVTTSCNQRCVYCQAQNGRVIPNGFMTKEVAKKAVDIAVQSPEKQLDFEFQGGEPLLNFDIIKFIVDYSKTFTDKVINYSIVTNLTNLTDDMLDYIAKNNIGISTSLDGKERLHNLNRPYNTGKGTYKDVVRQIKKIQSRGIYVGAIQTTTKESLSNYKDIVDTYIEMGFHNIFLRPLTPLGCAREHWREIGYSAEEYIDFYSKSLKYLLEVNRSGYKLCEGNSSIFLKKILGGYGTNYMELRSPCGAVIGQMAYYYDGNIFSCDEGRMLYEMGDNSFNVGNVFESTYDSILNNERCKLFARGSLLEGLPSCCDCVYQPYCGVCPVVNYASDNDIYEVNPGNFRCKIYQGVLDTIFSYLYDDDGTYEKMFRSWI